MIWVFSGEKVLSKFGAVIVAEGDNYQLALSSHLIMRVSGVLCRFATRAWPLQSGYMSSLWS